MARDFRQVFRKLTLILISVTLAVTLVGVSRSRTFLDASELEVRALSSSSESPLSQFHALKKVHGRSHLTQNPRNGSSSQPDNVPTSSTLFLRIPNEEFPSKTIYFLETSGLPFLSPKQLCAVESAAYHNRHRPIGVAATTKYLMLTSQLQNILDQYTNIQIVHLDLAAWVSGTKLEPWLAKGLLDKSKFRVSHTSDTLRYVTLFKYGGVYLDMDLNVLRSLDGFKNGIGLEDDEATANGAVMAFDKGHPVMDMCMEGILQHFDGNNWTSNGPGPLSKTLKEWCGLPANGNCVHRHAKECMCMTSTPSTLFITAS